VNNLYLQKASIPRTVRTAGNLREALARWGTDRLLSIVDANREMEDKYRREYGQIHKRYANMTFLIAEAIENNNLKYTTETLLHWIIEDFENASTGAQKDAAGLCGAELSKIMEMFGEDR
jgi:hypothetical protein